MSDYVRMIDEASAKLLAQFATPEQWRAAESGDGFSQLWERLEDSGFLDTLAAPDEDDALKGAAAFALIRNAGRALTPAPIGETVFGRALMALAPRGPIALDARRAAYGRHCRIVILQEGETLRGAEIDAVQRQGVNIAGEPRDDVTPEGPATLNLRAVGAAVRAAQMAGAIERVLMLSVDYARTRKQFGRPIGQFQAIQQSLAILAGHAAAALAASEAALRGWRRTEFPVLAAAAKIRAGEAAGAAIAIAHQTHGAIGVTKDHELHFATRRLHAWRAEFGAESEWSKVLGRWAVGQGHEGFWPALTAL